MKSRFAYHGEGAAQGGIRPASPRARSGRPHASSNGVPGPAETLLDITELVRHVGMRYVHRFTVPADAEPELSALAPLEGSVTLTNTGAALLLHGSASTRMEMECSRCLAPTVQEVSAELEEQFALITSHNAYHQEEILAIDENAEAPVIEGNILNLGELLRQSLLLAAPSLPVCPHGCVSDQEGRWRTEPETRVEEDSGSASPLRRLGELWQQRPEAKRGEGQSRDR